MAQKGRVLHRRQILIDNLPVLHAEGKQPAVEFVQGQQPFPVGEHQVADGMLRVAGDRHVSMLHIGKGILHGVEAAAAEQRVRQQLSLVHALPPAVQADALVPAAQDVQRVAHRQQLLGIKIVIVVGFFRFAAQQRPIRCQRARAQAQGHHKAQGCRQNFPHCILLPSQAEPPACPPLPCITAHAGIIFHLQAEFTTFL